MTLTLRPAAWGRYLEERRRLHEVYLAGVSALRSTYDQDLALIFEEYLENVQGPPVTAPESVARLAGILTCSDCGAWDSLPHTVDCHYLGRVDHGNGI